MLQLRLSWTQKPRILRFTRFNACPFCVKVRRELRRHALNIELRDARNDEEHKQALINGGGRFKVRAYEYQRFRREILALNRTGCHRLHKIRWNWRKQRMRPKAVKL